VSSFDSITKRLRELPRGGRLLSPLLGLVFLGYPIRVMLESNPTPTRVLLTLGGDALFAGVFLWLMWMHDPLPSAMDGWLRPALTQREVRRDLLKYLRAVD
jgi:hypothetical protein